MSCATSPSPSRAAGGCSISTPTRSRSTPSSERARWPATSTRGRACACREPSMEPSSLSGRSSGSRSRWPAPALSPAGCPPLTAGRSRPRAARPAVRSPTHLPGRTSSPGRSRRPADAGEPGPGAHRAVRRSRGGRSRPRRIAEAGDTEHRLLAMRGIGPWTAGYIRMRALRDPDVWLGTDLEVVKALARLPGGRASPVVAVAFLCRASTLVRSNQHGDASRTSATPCSAAPSASCSSPRKTARH